MPRIPDSLESPEDRVSHSKENDPSSWVDQYGDALFRYAYFRVNNQAQAEDLVQDTFLAALKSFDRFDQRSSVRTWLTGILKHKVVDYYRKNSRVELFSDLTSFYEHEARKSFADNGHWKVDSSTAPADWKPEQQSHLDRQEFWEQFHHCSNRLSEKVRQVFLMREVDGFSSQEICDQLGISRQNLWTILHRARMSLRQCLAKHWVAASEV